MPRRDWTRDELVLAMNLYCQLPFGKLHRRNPEVIRLANAIGRTPSSAAMKLCNLASLDPMHQLRGVKGLSGASAADRAIWNEFHADWERLAAESELLRQNRVERNETLGEQAPVTAQDDSPAYTGETERTREVRIRLAQRFFRRSVLASYNWRCCISDIGLKPLLIASHIMPWSDFPLHRADPCNGLCLSRLHDVAFDRGLIAFDHHRRLVLSKELRDSTTNRVLNESFLRFEGAPLRLPDKFQPDTAFLARHYADVFSG